MKKFIKENWFKIFTVIIILVIAIVYIMSNRYSFVKKEKSNRFTENSTIEVIMKCDKFTGECEETK